MFVIRRAQLQAFSTAAMGDFVKRMVLHLGQVFPEESVALGEAGLRAMIHEGIERAGRYGIESEYSICLYLHVMMALGARFDESEPWARELLVDPALGPANGVSVLHDRVFERVGEPMNEHEAH